jgi:hypothetical protein
MTTLEALKANISDTHGVVVSENAFLKALLDEGIVTTATYSKDDYEQSIDLAIIRVYKQILGSAGFSEGNFQYSPAAKESIQKSIDILLNKWGLASESGQGTPTARDASKRW